MDQNGIAEFGHHRGYISSVITNDDLHVVKSAEAGFFHSEVSVGEFVYKGQRIATILDPYDGHILTELTTPVDGTIFFIQSNPLAFANGQLMLIIK
ncbi:MAG: succinylglutamate desuccinylase/aspartoacylase family protein [Mogibacterium sp.]|nr:succinylglutamate desuccinylase/aspartoacylase family protein [Mogibacterium sp.]